MAITNASINGDTQPPRSSSNDAAAQSVYGNPARPDATREPRLQNIADVAAAHTSDGASQSAIGGAFIQDNGEAAHQWTRTAGKSAGATIKGDAGFPGLYGPYPGP